MPVGNLKTPFPLFSQFAVLNEYAVSGPVVVPILPFLAGLLDTNRTVQRVVAINVGIFIQQSLLFFFCRHRVEGGGSHRRKDNPQISVVVVKEVCIQTRAAEEATLKHRLAHRIDKGEHGYSVLIDRLAYVQIAVRIQSRGRETVVVTLPDIDKLQQPARAGGGRAVQGIFP